MHYAGSETPLKIAAVTVKLYWQQHSPTSAQHGATTGACRVSVQPSGRSQANYKTSNQVHQWIIEAACTVSFDNSLDSCFQRGCTLKNLFRGLLTPTSQRQWQFWTQSSVNVTQCCFRAVWTYTWWWNMWANAFSRSITGEWCMTVTLVHNGHKYLYFNVNQLSTVCFIIRMYHFYTS